MIKKKMFFSLLIIALALGACAPKRKGMRKSRKKDCDCPSFSQANHQTNTVKLIPVLYA